ncbi:MAG: ComF family protein [Ignavibacteria bacterium]|nr:ComF family protein [Ignavibacteria bacterium]
MIRHILRGFLNFVLPETCLSCGESTSENERYLCGNCSSKLEPYTDTHPWQKEFVEAGIIENSISAYWFREGTPIQPLLHAMKYQKVRSAGRLLGEAIGRRIAGTAPGFDYIIPVPLHKAKQRERTFNQSLCIAEGISAITRTAILEGAVNRTRFTSTQTKLNKAERRENVLHAFDADPEHIEDIRGKRIILADDVITTGATIIECASVLKRSGAGVIWICSAAYAELKHTE